MTTVLAVGFTFIAAWAALFVLHLVYRVTVAVVRIALPVLLVLLMGCAFDWPWAESAMRWLRATAHHGVVAVTHGLAALHSG